MKKITILIILGLFTVVLHAQEFQGKALYQSKFRMDVKLDSTRISPNQQQQIMEMMRKQMEKSFELIFDKNTSIYKEEAKLEQEAGGFGGMMIMIGGAMNGKLFKDVKNKMFTKESEMMGKNFVIKDSLTTYNWKLVNESKMIGKYLNFKAVATVKSNEMSFNMRGGRSQNRANPNDSIASAPRDIIIEAWYSPEVPVNNGPGEYWGLPGLIMEVNADRMSLQMVSLDLNPKEKIKITEPDKGKVVSQKEYNEIMKAKMEEMRENFEGGRKQGNDSHRIQIRM
jgi:GLPGLI family protein